MPLEFDRNCLEDALQALELANEPISIFSHAQLMIHSPNHSCQPYQDMLGKTIFLDLPKIQECVEQMSGAVQSPAANAAELAHASDALIILLVHCNDAYAGRAVLYRVRRACICLLTLADSLQKYLQFAHSQQVNAAAAPDIAQWRKTLEKEMTELHDDWFEFGDVQDSHHDNVYLPLLKYDEDHPDQ